MKCLFVDSEEGETLLVRDLDIIPRKGEEVSFISKDRKDEREIEGEVTSVHYDLDYEKITIKQ
jgi:predicted RNA-binding protein